MQQYSQQIPHKPFTMRAVSNNFCLYFIVKVLAINCYPKEFYNAAEPHYGYFDEEAFHSDHQHHHHNHQHSEDLSGSTLVLSHIIFRHGNRTPDSIQELYPNDPYLNESYYPYGLGQLTNAGKLREYTIGTTLRTRYQSFINDMYMPAEVEALTTDYNRTKASLALVLAGLYPPQTKQIWKDDLMWQPIPYNFVSRNQDKVLLGVMCPNYLKMYEKVKGSMLMRKQYETFRSVFNYISKHSGLNVTSFQQIYNLYFGLSTEEEYGFNLPKWTSKVWPQIVTEVAIKEYYVMMANEDLRKMGSGYLLKKILEDTQKKIVGNGTETKIYLYSAHENNIAQFLILLDTFHPHVPNYGAHVIVEVHRVNGLHGIKLFYQNWETEEPVQLEIPKCGTFCPLKRFSELFAKYLPEDNLCGN